MLSDKLRDGANSKAFKTLLALIVISFVLTGVGGYLIPRLDTDPVKIGDYKISAGEWTDQYNRRAQQLSRNGPEAAALLENPAYVTFLKKQVLESMIDNVAFNSVVWDMNVRIGDAEVRDVIRRTPAFQKDGKFDNNLYLASVRNMGMNPEYFGEQLRVSLMSETVSTPLMSISSVPMPYEVEQAARLFGQNRKVNLYTLDRDHVAKNVTVSDSEAQEYYNANNKEFMAPATAKFSYLLLSLNDLKDQVEVTNDKLEEFFSMYSEDFMLGEQRRLSHIIIRSDSPKAKDKIAAVEKALSNGTTKEEFAKLAKQYSDDEATKDAGGDMGLVSQGQLAANLDSALFALKQVGDVSSKIVDSYGTHFIALTEIKEAHVPTLAEVKDRVTAAYITTQARDLFNTKLSTMSDLSFENPDSLDATAEALGIKVQESNLVAQNDKNANWPFNTKAVQDLAFDPDVYSSGVNSQVVSIDEENAIVINVSEHHDASLKPFAEVKDLALELVRNKKISEAATKDLEALAVSLQKDIKAAVPEYVKVQSEVEVNMGSTAVSPLLNQAIMALPRSEKLPYTINDNNGTQTLAVMYEIEEANGETLDGFKRLIEPQMRMYLSNNTQSALYRQARELSEIEYNDEAINLVTRQTPNE